MSQRPHRAQNVSRYFLVYCLADETFTVVDRQRIHGADLSTGGTVLVDFDGFPDPLNCRIEFHGNSRYDLEEEGDKRADELENATTEPSTSAPPKVAKVRKYYNTVSP